MGVDVGTTNWKAAVFDEVGHLVALAKTSAVTHYDERGWASYDPGELWRLVADVIAAAVRQTGSAGGIAAVTVASMAESVVPLDRSGEPVSQVIAWFDTRSLPQAQQLERLLGRGKLYALTGLDPNPIFSVPKIMWYRDHEPEVYAHTKKWLSIADYVNYKLTGETVTDYSLASRTMALNLETGTWSGEILSAAGLQDTSLPEIRPSGTLVGTVTDAAAAETSLLPGTPVVLGGHDHLCGSLGAGVLLDHGVLDSSGTAESLIALSEPGAPIPKEFRGFRLGRYLDPRRYVTWGGIISSGSSIDWALNQFASLTGWGMAGNQGCPDYSEVMAAAAETPPGARGLLYLPHLRGCGAPHWEPRARGALIGLRSTHTQPELVRAVVEGLCFEVKLILDLMERVAGRKIRTLNTVGGGARNAFWQQTKADVTGRTVTVPEIEEATPLGAALLAGLGAGVYGDMVEASRFTYRVRHRFEPVAERQEVYRALFHLYKQAYPALIDLNIGLHDLAGE